MPIPHTCTPYIVPEDNISFEVSFLNSVSRIVVTLTFANYVLEYLKLKQRA